MVDENSRGRTVETLHRDVGWQAFGFYPAKGKRSEWRFLDQVPANEEEYTRLERYLRSGFVIGAYVHANNLHIYVNISEFAFCKE